MKDTVLLDLLKGLLEQNCLMNTLTWKSCLRNGWIEMEPDFEVPWSDEVGDAENKSS